MFNIESPRRARFLATVAGLALCAAPAIAFAQSGTIAGTVRDQTSQAPLTDVRIVITGTTLGTLSNQQGEFRLATVRPGRAIVSAFRIGYKPAVDTVNVVAGQTATVTFNMTESLVNLSEVVVTGTAGNQERKAQAAVVASLQTADVLKDAPVMSVANLLQSRVPGVALSAMSGTAGTATTIRIRGASSITLSNQPLIFVDGVRMNEGQIGAGAGGQSYDRFNDLSPDEIESIKVVKGPAAATLYGADASAGVIQIITKKGNPGSNRFIQSVRMEGGTVDRNYDPPDNYGLCTAALAASTSTNPLCRGQAVGTLVHDNPLLRSNSFRTGADYAFSWNGRGGGQNYGYNLSYSSQLSHGVVLNNNFDRYNVRTNVNFVPTDQLTFDVGVGFIQSLAQVPNNDNNIYGWLGGAMLGSPLTVSDAAAPSNNGWYGFNRGKSAIAAIDSRILTHRVMTNFQSTYVPRPWFNNRFTLGLDYAQDDQRNFFPKNDSTWYAGAANTGSLTATSREAERYTFDYLGNLRNEISSNWEANLSFGLQVVSTRNTVLGATAQGFVTNANNSVSSGATLSGSGGFTEQRQFGYLSQVQFANANKRFVQFAVRVDKNSSFGSSAPAFVLPKVGVSWSISDENFFDNWSKYVNTLRFRAAWGTTGRSPAPGSALTTLVAAAYNISGATGAGAIPGNPGNANLKPEKGTEFETGFDAGFLKDRLSAELTYFRKTTNDMILAKPIPPSLGFNTNPLANIGSVLNEGVELSLNYDAFRGRNLGWVVNAGVSTLHNEITSLGGLPSFAAGGSTRFIEGQQLGVFVSKKVLSIDEATNIVTVADTLTPIGNLYPTVEWNLTNTVTIFRNLRLSALLDSKRNFSVLNNTAYFRETQLVRSNLRIDTTALSRRERLRRYGNLTPGKPAFVTDKGNTAVVGDVMDGFIEPGDFTRLRELSATYMIPKSWLGNFGGTVSDASITLAFQNVKLWTNYSGADPEVNAQSGAFSREDFLTMPNPKKTVLRVNFNF